MTEHPKSGRHKAGQSKLPTGDERERKRIEDEEDEVTISSDDSFPASDPPSFNPSVIGSPIRRKGVSGTNKPLAEPHIQ
jgi:hypothetical protein